MLRKKKLDATRARKLAGSQYPPVTLNEVLEYVERSANGGREMTTFFYHQKRELPAGLENALQGLGFVVNCSCRAENELGRYEMNGIRICWHG